MGFDLYVVTTGAGFAEREILEAFGGHISARPDGGFAVRYDDVNESTIDCDFTEARTSDFLTVHRPCADDRLFEALHRLLVARPSFLTYPSDKDVCIVANEASASAVREKFRETAPELVQVMRVCGTAQELIGSW